MAVGAVDPKKLEAQITQGIFNGGKAGLSELSEAFGMDLNTPKMEDEEEEE